MENRFLEFDRQVRQRERRATGNGAAVADVSAAQWWAAPLSTADRVLVILIDNGGVDLGIPELVNKLFAAIPGGDAIPDTYKQSLVTYVRDTLRKITDNLLETLELTVNRYSAAKPDLFGDVVVLRDGAASYDELKSRLIALSSAGKIVDLFVLTHGSSDYISVTGGIDGRKIRAMKTAYGQPLSIRSVYMMNCVGSSLNQAWLDAGAKVSSGAIRNNYLPEPTMYFFWENWKAGQTFENAVTGAYRKTIKLMNDAIRGFLGSLPIPSSILDVENLDFVRDSAPVIQGQRSVTITTDDLTFAQGLSSSLATTVLPVSLLRTLSDAPAAPETTPTARSLSPAGVEFIKRWEGFRAQMYNDPVGHCTIGYGTLLHMGNCDGRTDEQPWAGGITEEKATELLERHAAEFQHVINETVTVPLNQNQNDALVSFAYNVGGANFRTSTLLKRLNEKNYAAVPVELKKWTKARQNGKLIDLPGLVTRRQAEADLFDRAPNGAVAQSLSGVDYSVPGILEPMAQRTPRTCWANVITMMYSWRKQLSVAPETVLAEAGPQYVQMYKDDRGLDAVTAVALYDALELERITSFNPTIEHWESLLRHYGPLYVDVGYGTSTMTHALIVTGISGDGTATGTTITYIDPVGGRVIPRRFSEFLAEYEAPGAVNNWPHVIVHWPAPVATSSSLSGRAYAFTDANSTQSEQSLEVRRRIARSVGQAEAGGRFDLVHDDSNRVNFGLGSWTGSRIADVLDTYEQVAAENGTTNTLHGYFGGQAAFDAFRQRFRTQGVAATASTAERAALRRLGADVSLQDAQIRHLANDIRADLDSVGNTGNPWYPFIDGGMGAISELAAHVLVHAKHQAGGLSAVLTDAINHFGGEAALGPAMVNGTVTERQFLDEVANQIVRRVQAKLQAGVRNRYQTLFNNHSASDLSYYFNPAN